MPQAIYILFGAAFTVAVCLAAGRLLILAWRNWHSPASRAKYKASESQPSYKRLAL